MFSSVFQYTWQETIKTLVSLVQMSKLALLQDGWQVTVNLRIRIPCSEPGGGSSKATRLVNPIAQPHLALRLVVSKGRNQSQMDRVAAQSPYLLPPSPCVTPFWGDPFLRSYYHPGIFRLNAVQRFAWRWIAPIWGMVWSGHLWYPWTPSFPKI